MFASSQEALSLTETIHDNLNTGNTTLSEMSKYYFDGQGKAVRPALTLIMSGACNSHLKVNHGVLNHLIRLREGFKNENKNKIFEFSIGL